MRFRLFLIIPLFMVASTDAKTYTFHFPPPGVNEACQKYRDLESKGLSVKAERHKEQYIKKHLAVFRRNSDESPRTYRLLIPGGWLPYRGGSGSVHFLGSVVRSVDDSGNHEQEGYYIGAQNSSIEVPEKMQETWEDTLHEKFLFHTDNEHSKEHIEWTFSEITVREKDYPALDFCALYESGNLGLSGSLVLVSYKLQKRPRNKDTTTSSPSGNGETEIEAEPESKKISSMPSLLFFDEEGEPVAYTDIVSAKPAVLNFTASYCTSCEDELKELRKLHDASKNLSATLMIVDIDDKNNQAAYRKRFSELMNYEHPGYLKLLFDPYQKNYQKMASGDEKLPLTLLIDEKGRVKHRVVGYKPEELKKLYKILEGMR